MSINLIKKLKDRPSEECTAVIKAVNRCLEGDWSDKQLQNGMMFEIRDYWMSFYRYIIQRYKDVGWKVKTRVELMPGERKVYLNIQHPDYPKKKNA